MDGERRAEIVEGVIEAEVTVGRRGGGETSSQLPLRLAPLFSVCLAFGLAQRSGQLAPWFEPRQREH